MFKKRNSIKGERVDCVVLRTYSYGLVCFWWSCENGKKEVTSKRGSDNGNGINNDNNINVVKMLQNREICSSQILQYYTYDPSKVPLFPFFPSSLSKWSRGLRCLPVWFGCSFNFSMQDSCFVGVNRRIGEALQGCTSKTCGACKFNKKLPLH